ncbi:enterobactin exporter EntS [compost metagenome]
MSMLKSSFTTFLVLWLGELTSSIGSGLTAFGLGVYVFQMTHSATAVSLVTLCAFLPIILLAPVGGVLADRFDRRLMMLIGDGGSVLGLLYILLIMMIGHMEVWHICIGVALSSIFASLTDPAYRATITDLLSKEQYAQASGMVQLAGASKYLISPVLAGLFIGVIGIEGILLLDMSTFLVTLLTIIVVRSRVAASCSTDSKTREHSNFWAELKEGWHIVMKAKGVRCLMLILTLVTFFIGFLETLFTPLVLPLSDARTLGIVESISATGLLLGSLFIGVFSIRKQYSKVMAVGLFMSGIFFALLGMTTNVVLITIMGFFFFAALAFVNTSADVLIRTHIPNETQGRAWGMIGLISQLGYVAAYASAGILSDAVFNPLLTEHGALATTVGAVIGTGPGRGIGLLLLLAGVMVMFTAVMLIRVRAIRELETSPALQ